MSASGSSTLHVVQVPAGPAGLEVARRVVDDALGGQGPAIALVHDRDASESVVRPDLPLDDSRTRLIVLTSGSTGDPKGVCWSAENMLATSSMWAQVHADVTDAPRIVALPLTSAGGLGAVVRGVLDQAPLIALPSIGGAARFDTGVFAATVASVGDAGPITSLVPTQLAMLLQDPVGREALAQVRRIFLGGAAAPESLVVSARNLGCDVVPTYGMTETCGGCVHDGVPLPGVDVHLDAGGRIYLSGPMCALGYRLRPEETAAAFTAAPPGAPGFAEPTFATEDVGAWVDGRLRVLGRIDDIVQVRGTNVALGAIERVLVESGLAREAVICALPDDVDGHRLVGLAIPDPDQQELVISGRWSAAIADAVRANLGSPAIPSWVRPASVLPYLPGGKIDRRAVYRMVAEDDSTEGNR